MNFKLITAAACAVALSGCWDSGKKDDKAAKPAEASKPAAAAPAAAPAAPAAPAAAPAAPAAPVAAGTKTQYMAIPSSRVGPYSAMGTGYYGAQIDYINYINATGGIKFKNKSGSEETVKLVYQECETEYNAAKTVECYQRLLTKDGQKMVVFDTLGTPGAYAVINRMADDKVVLAQYGYGRTDAADGRVWPYVFNAVGHYWSQIAVTLRFMAEIENGGGKGLKAVNDDESAKKMMKGKKIVHLHIDTAYGREPLPAMRKICKDWGVELVEISITPPGLEQKSQWLQIKDLKPDWVTFWGAGSGMNSAALREAARIDFPRNRMMYVTFGGAEEDMKPAGPEADGTYVVVNAFPGTFPLNQKIKDTLYKAGQGNMADPNRVGTVYYNRGLGAIVMQIEALKDAIAKNGGPVDGPQFRDAYERLDTNPAKLTEIGISGMIAPVKMSCANHAPNDAFGLQQWNFKEDKFVKVQDFTLPLDAKMIRELIEESAAKYAKENNITPKKCEDDSKAKAEAPTDKK